MELRSEFWPERHNKPELVPKLMERNEPRSENFGTEPITVLLIYKKYAPFLWKKLGASNYSGAWGGLYAASVTEATINSLRSASLIQL